MARNADVAVQAAFAPFVSAAGEPAYAGDLKTRDLPSERKKAQFAKFRSLVAYEESPLYLPGNGFIARFKHSGGHLLIISDNHLDDDGREELGDWALDFGLAEDQIDEALFLVLCSEMDGFYKPVGLNLKSQRAENLLAIVGADYEGHEISEMIDWYQSVAIFSIPEDHKSREMSLYRLASEIAAQNLSYRPDIITNEVAGAIRRLNDLPNINPENTYYALTSTHWKHCFMDVYRCLEAVFYLPWTISLRDSLSSTLSALALAKECRRNLVWREREKTSIGKIFDLVEEEVARPPNLKTFGPLQDLYGNDAGADKFGERIYKIRNQLVHQEDYEDPVLISIDQAEWEPLCIYLASVVEAIYVSRARDIDYSFDVAA